MITPDAPAKYTMYEDGATPWMRDMAKDILGVLDLVYPGHPWACRVYGDDKGGGYFIRHLDLDANFGMNQPMAHMFSSASELRADVIRKGGELLERAGLKRGWWNEDPIFRMEGIPEKWQPNPHPQDVREVNKVVEAVATAEREMRDKPLPQVSEILNGRESGS